MAKTSACRAEDPGSIPGWGVPFFQIFKNIYILKFYFNVIGIKYKRGENLKI